MDPTTAIITTLIVYKVVLLGIGFLASRRTQDEEDFYLGGRKLGPLVSAVSASASSSSAWTLLGVSGAAYTWGLGAIWLFPACVGGFLLNWIVVAPRLARRSRESDALTLTAFLSGGDQRGIRSPFVLIAGLLVLTALGIYVGQQFNAAGKTFEQSLGMDATTSILLGATIVVAYTLLGGFLAVSLTDTLQGLVMALTAIAVPIAAYLEVGGLGPLIDHFADAGDAAGWFRGMAPAAAIGFVVGLLGIGIGYPGQPHVVNRFMAMRDGSKTMNQARAIAIGWAVLVYGGMLVAGWCGRLLFADVADGQKVLIQLTETLFAPVLAGVMLAAILSAMMSTADSLLLVGGSTVSHDFRVAEGDGRRRVLVSRLVVLGLSLLGTVIALYGNRDIFTQTLFAWGLLGSGFGPLLLITLLRGPVKPGARLLAITVATALTIATRFQDAPNNVQVLVIPFASAFAIALIGSERRTTKE